MEYGISVAQREEEIAEAPDIPPAKQRVQKRQQQLIQEIEGRALQSMQPKHQEQPKQPKPAASLRVFSRKKKGESKDAKYRAEDMEKKEKQAREKAFLEQRVKESEAADIWSEHMMNVHRQLDKIEAEISKSIGDAPRPTDEELGQGQGEDSNEKARRQLTLLVP